MDDELDRHDQQSETRVHTGGQQPTRPRLVRERSGKQADESEDSHTKPAGHRYRRVESPESEPGEQHRNGKHQSGDDDRPRTSKHPTDLLT